MTRRVEKSHWAKKEEKPSGQLTTKKKRADTQKKRRNQRINIQNENHWIEAYSRFIIIHIINSYLIILMENELYIYYILVLTNG